MKAYILLVYLFIISNLLLAQCPNDGQIIFDRQSQVDSFTINYPNCDSIHTLEISGSIENLLAFHNLKRLSVLFIHDNNELHNLEGLENVEHILGINLFGNRKFKSIATLGQKNPEINSISIFNKFGIKDFDFGNIQIIKYFHYGSDGADSNPINLNAEDTLRITNGIFEKCQLHINNSIIFEGSLQISEPIGLNSFYDLLKQYHFDDLNQLVISGIDSFNTDGIQMIGHLDTLSFAHILVLELDSIVNFKSDLKALGFGECDDLKDLSPLSTLKVTEFGIIGDNALVTLDGLNTELLRKIRIMNCESISDISILNSIDTFIGSKSVTIINNPELAVCNVLPICKLISSNVTNAFLIWNNKIGCNNLDEISESCLTDISPVNTHANINIYPNPVEDILTIDYDGVIQQCIIYSSSGYKLLTDTASTINVSLLTPGLYFLKVFTSKGEVVGRFVKE